MKSNYIGLHKVLLVTSLLLIAICSCQEDSPNPINPSTLNSGEVIFWEASANGCSDNTVIEINNQTQEISSFAVAIPGCGTTGFANFKLTPGVYNYTAKCSTYTQSGTITVKANECTKRQLIWNIAPPSTNQGQMTFWESPSSSCAGNTDVTINGVTRQITSTNAATPSCGTTGTATFTLAPGTYNYSAKCSGVTKTGSVTINANQCSTLQLIWNTTNNLGQVIFWESAQSACQNATNVTINGVTKQITGTYSSAPQCGSSGGAAFSLAPGNYNYSATCSGVTKTGSVTINANQCSTQQLIWNATSNLGQVIFWESAQSACQNATNVTINGITKQITGTYSSAPQCGSSGGAAFSLAPGTYNYSATCSGSTITGSVTINTNQCSTKQLIWNTTSNLGQVIFWESAQSACQNATNVTINGVTKQITSTYSSTPQCGSTGGAAFSLAPGTYNYSATCSGVTKTGSVTINANQCSTQQLIWAPNSNKGQVIFWTKGVKVCTADLGSTSRVYVRIASVDANYYGIPSFLALPPTNCSPGGVVVYSLNPGTYTYDAYAQSEVFCNSNRLTWQGTVTITAGDCNIIGFKN